RRSSTACAYSLLKGSSWAALRYPSAALTCASEASTATASSWRPALRFTRCSSTPRAPPAVDRPRLINQNDKGEDMFHLPSRRFLGPLTAALIGMAATGAHAQAVTTIVVAFPPGGPADSLARVVATQLE